MDIVTLSLGLGLVINLAFSEIFGLAAGGMIVPGYLALYLNKPVTLILTLLASVLTFFIVHFLGTVMIIYGRRRTVLMILTGFLFTWFIRYLGLIGFHLGHEELGVIGYIIPGLIAIWIDRQGIIETLGATITGSVMIRLILILILRGRVGL